MSESQLRWLCWALIVLVVISAVLTLGLSLDLFFKTPNPPDTVDYVDRLLQYRAYDSQVYSLALLSGLVGVGIFVAVALLGSGVRQLARPGSGRDMMTTLFVLAGAVGVIAQLLNMAVAQAGTYSYCDCGYKTEEVISLAYALGMAITAQTWFAIGSVILVGAGTAAAGSMIEVSRSWRWLSYLIALLLVGAAALLFLGYGQESNLVVGVTLIVAVPIWLIMLTRTLGTRTASNSDPAAT